MAITFDLPNQPWHTLSFLELPTNISIFKTGIYNPLIHLFFTTRLDIVQMYYSLRSIKLVSNIDVSRHIFVCRYIHISDKFYGMQGVISECNHTKTYKSSISRMWATWLWLFFSYDLSSPTNRW
jgi:hypothetical protein